MWLFIQIKPFKETVKVKWSHIGGTWSQLSDVLVRGAITRPQWERGDDSEITTKGQARQGGQRSGGRTKNCEKNVLLLFPLGLHWSRPTRLRPSIYGPPNPPIIKPASSAHAPNFRLILDCSVFSYPVFWPLLSLSSGEDERFSWLSTQIHGPGHHAHLNAAGENSFYLRTRCEVCSVLRPSTWDYIHLLEAVREKRTGTGPMLHGLKSHPSDLVLPARLPVLIHP